MCAAASVIMPRSFLIKKQNYSHCPLKKRPVVQIYKEVAEVKDEPEDNSEPENLSTKPEDLIRTSSSVHQYYKSLTPPLGVTPISSASKTTPVDGSSGVHSPTLTPTHPRPPTPPMPAVVSSPTAISSSSSPPSPLPYPYQHHTGAFTPIHYPKPVGGPLEPLNLNTAHAEHLHYWPRGAAASLAPYHPPPPPPPTYLPFGYHTAAPYHHHHHHHHHTTATPSYLTPPGHDQLSPYAPPRESAPSPPSPLPPPPPPVQTSTRPTYVPAAHPLVASLPHQPRLYMPYLTSNSTSPDLPEYYTRSSPIHSLPINPLPPPTPEEDGDENARPSVVEFVSHGHPAPPSPPLSSSTVEDLSSPSTPPGDSAPTSVSPSPVAAKKSKTTTSSSTRHQCSDCSKSYSTFSGLSKHRQFHCKGANGGSATTGSKKSKAQAGANGEPVATFSCKHCDKTYVSLGALKMHIRTHTLPCECKLCGKAFSRPWLLQGHIRTHTGEKPFSCQHCCRAFADRSNLRAHLQTHSDVKKYSCPRCARTFSRMSLLAKHADGGCVGNVSTNNNNNNITVNNNNKSSAMQISSQVSGNDGKIKSEEMRMEVSQVPMAGDYYHVPVKSEVSY